MPRTAEPTQALYVRIPVSLRKDLDARLAKLDEEWSTRTNMTTLIATLLRAGLDATKLLPGKSTKKGGSK
jgi:hypothetical protein